MTAMTQSAKEITLRMRPDRVRKAVPRFSSTATATGTFGSGSCDLGLRSFARAG
jgi:hypothetical protein